MEDEKAVRHILSLLSGLPEEASYHDHARAIMNLPDNAEFPEESSIDGVCLPLERGTRNENH